MLGLGPERLTIPEALFKFTLLPPLVGDDGHVDTQYAHALLAKDEFFKRWGIELSDDLPPRVSASELVDRMVLAFGRKAGKPNPSIWIDHTPGNIRYASSLSQMFPASRFVHLVRDGRAVAASILPLDWGPNTIADAARWWSMHIAIGLAGERTLGPERVLTVRYEDVVCKPEVVLPKICRFAGLSYDERMIYQRDFDARAFTMTEERLAGQRPDPARTVAWKRRLRGSEVEFFEHLTWELLDLLGYEMVYGAAARMAPRGERLAAFAQDVLRRGLTDRIRRRRRPEPNRS